MVILSNVSLFSCCNISPKPSLSFLPNSGSSSNSYCPIPYSQEEKVGGGPFGQGVTRGLDLSGKDFSGQTLIRLDFKMSIPRQANFKGSKLLGASFFDADLTGADLSEADLTGADFSLANVTKVNFKNANLEGVIVTGNTSFKGSNITGAEFTDVPLRDDQRKYLCQIADGVNSTTGIATRDTLLCN